MIDLVRPSHVRITGAAPSGLGRLFVAALLIAASRVMAADAAYPDLPQAKALAVSPAHPHRVQGLAYGQANELAASALARERCEKAARDDGEDVCEIVRLNGDAVTTAAEIRSRVPDGSHPLFLWRYRQGDTIVYLAGSIHVLKPSLYPMPEPFDAAFQRSDTLVLEVDVASLSPAEIQRRTLARARLPDGQTLSDVLPPDLLARLTRHMADFGMTPNMMRWAKPAMVMNQLVIARLLTLGYLPDSGLERYFLSRRGTRRIEQLETLDQQLELLFDQPMDTQIQLLSDTLATDDRIEPLLADLVTAWLSGQDQRFLELFAAESGDSEASKQFLHELLDARNAGMARVIESYLTAAGAGARPRTYFVLVGAAHLVGQQGIVNLLARDGYSGTRVRSDQSIPLKETAP